MFSYKLIVRVEDASARTTFTLFNKEAEQLIGVPVENLVTQHSEVHIVSPRIIVVTTLS